MERRKFIGLGLGLGLSSALVNTLAVAQGTSKAVGRGDEILPKERSEKRVYDRSVPEVVVWHTGADTSTIRTVGFVEAASDKNKLLYLSGFVLRKDIYPDLDKGFYLYFKTSFSYLALPRRLLGEQHPSQERYAFSEQTTVLSAEGIKAGLVRVDYRNTKLIEDGKVYSPESIVLESRNSVAGSSEAASVLQRLEGPITYPDNDVKRSYLWVSETLYFRMDHIPLNFKLEMPPLVINGFEVPFPICYFEPYNILTKKWG